MGISVDLLLENIGIKRSVRYGVAFSGGGARGFAHLGVLMALERFGIKPGILAGVSAGSIAAVLYAAGLSPKEIADCFSAYPKFSDYSEWTIPKEGFFKLDRFAKILDSWLPVKRLEELNVPTVVCATDFEKGKSVGWTKGEIVPRVIASCSIPIIFPPVKVGDSHYVDGGLLHNLPAWAIRPYCSTLIGSNCSPLDRKYKYKNSIIDLAFRSYKLISKANVLQDIKQCDLVIQSDGLSSYSTFNITAMKRIIKCGYEAACLALENSSILK